MDARSHTHRILSPLCYSDSFFKRKINTFIIASLWHGSKTPSAVLMNADFRSALGDPMWGTSSRPRRCLWPQRFDGTEQVSHAKVSSGQSSRRGKCRRSQQRYPGLFLRGTAPLSGCQRLLDLTPRAAFVCSASQADVCACMDLCVEMDSTARQAKCQFSKPPE